MFLLSLYIYIYIYIFNEIIHQNEKENISDKDKIEDLERDNTNRHNEWSCKTNN